MKVSFEITPLGGHLSDVKFQFGKRVIEPFSTAPWCREAESTSMIPLLRVLRGDFFCAPFGAGPVWRGEAHPPHGEPANGAWQIRTQGPGHVAATMETRVRPGFLTKIVEARDGETNLYQTHVLEGYRGSMCIGHHAMLDFQRNGPGRLSTSRLRFGQVLPVPFEDPASGGYSSLRSGAWFQQLERVPMADGGHADLTRYPAREGFEDLVMLHHKDSDAFAWSAVVFPNEGFVWFSLKNPLHLVSTVLWHSNGGRHYPPWSGRHRGVLGVEDVTAYFHLGLAASVSKNPWREKGVPTSLRLNPRKSTRIPYIMGVAPIARGFDRVREVELTASGIRLHSTAGPHIDHSVDTSFLH